jgi:hypothetical protein
VTEFSASAVERILAAQCANLQSDMGVSKLSDGLTPSSPADSKTPTQTQADIPAVADPSVSKDACSELTTLARQALQEKRRKDCLVLTRAILAIDPDSKEAQVIENWVRSDLQKDIDEARAVIEQARQDNDSERFQRAEWLLRMILRVDPVNEQANTLLQEVRALESDDSKPDASKRSEDSPSELPAQASSDLLDEYPGYPQGPASRRGRYALIAIALILPLAGFVIWKHAVSGAPAAVPGAASVADAPVGTLEIALTDGVKVFINDEYRGTTPLMPLKLAPNVYRLRYQVDGKDIGEEEVKVSAGGTTRNAFQDMPGHLVFIVVPSAGVQLKIDGKTIGMAPDSMDVQPGEHKLEFSASGYSTASVTTTVAAGERTMVPVLLKSLVGDDGVKPASGANPNDAAKTNSPATVPPASPRNGARGATGTLAISSAVPVEIYENDKRIGATPANLELSAGPHTLEFHLEGLKKTVTYTIQAGAGATARVAFDITVRIQANPYADVSIDGNPTPLGQTPLRNVSVPVGAVLVFRYSNLPEKTYRVKAADADSAISMNFP